MRQLLKNLRLMTAMGLLTCGAVTHAAQINQAPDRLFQADTALQALETLDHDELNNIKGGLVSFSALTENQFKILVAGAFGVAFSGIAVNYAVRFPRITNSHINSLDIYFCKAFIGTGFRGAIAQSLLSNARVRDLELGIADMASMAAYSIAVGFSSSACTYGVGKFEEAFEFQAPAEALTLDRQQYNRTRELGVPRRKLAVEAIDDAMLFKMGRVQARVNDVIWCASTQRCDWFPHAQEVRERMIELANRITLQTRTLNRYYAHSPSREATAKNGQQRLKAQGNLVLQPQY